MLRPNSISFKEDYKFIKNRVRWQGSFCDIELFQGLFYPTRDAGLYCTDNSKPYELNPE